MLKAGTRVGPYEVLSPLGAGGMGEVYRARDSRLGRDVAIKVLPAEFAADPERLRRFEQEARAVAALDHPNILAIHDIGTYEGTPYIVTELLEGESLRDRLHGASLPPSKAVEIGVQSAQGLAAAHGKGIVHRDLKPGNVFVTKDGHVKILDFGLAKLAHAESAPDPYARTASGEPSTESGAVLGTMGYMSPEQLRGQPADARSDIYSFGCVLYEMLSGKAPFLRHTGPETASAILTEDPAPLSGSGRPVAPALQEIVGRRLEKRAEERFSSAHDLALALRAFSCGSDAPAKRRGFVRRTSGVRCVAFGAALVVLIGAALLGVRLLHRRAPTAPAASTPSIAVLPFTNASGDREQEYFSDGLSEELMGLLTKVKELRVAGRTSSFAFKGKDAKLADIGRELRVATVLEGSVRRSGNRLRVSAQLVNAADGYQIWAETYDRTMTDVFALQDDIAGAVVTALRVALLPSERTSAAPARKANPEAYTEYLLARQFSNRGSLDDSRRAIAAYDKAIKLVPDYAAAYAGLAVAAFYLSGYADDAKEAAEAEQRARQAVERALALDPTLAASYAARGSMRMLSFPPDWAGAHADLEKVLALDPGDVGARGKLGHLLCLQGRLPEAIAEARAGTDLDPLSGAIWRTLGWCLRAAGDLAGAEEAFGRAIEIDPNDAVSHGGLGVALIMKREPRAALAQFAKTTEPLRLMGVAMAEHDLGHAQDSNAALDELAAKFGGDWAYQVAMVHAWRDERELAFNWLERAYAQRDWGLAWLKADVVCSKLSSDPRYQELLRRMNFPGSMKP